MTVFIPFFKLHQQAVSFLSFIIFFFISIPHVQSANEHNPKAKAVVQHYFKNNEPNQYLLFSQNNEQYLIIEKINNSYKEHHLSVDATNRIIISKSEIVNEDTTVLQRAFQKEAYHQDYIDLNSDYFISSRAFSEGAPVYFYYKHSDGKTYGEASLTTTIHPNPIDVSIFGYLLTKISTPQNK